MTMWTTLLLLTATTEARADANALKARASSCFACHGANGVSPNPIWPNLAGQKEAYLVKQLQAFKSGERIHPLMTPQAKMLDEQDQRDVARYFSELKVTP